MSPPTAVADGSSVRWWSLEYKGRHPHRQPRPSESPLRPAPLYSDPTGRLPLFAPRIRRRQR